MATKKEQLAQEVAQGCGRRQGRRARNSRLQRPKPAQDLLEVDFPILPVNQVAVIEGNAESRSTRCRSGGRDGVPASSVDADCGCNEGSKDSSHAAKLVWDNYYANHQKKGAFKNLKVADIFMGGGTTLVEGSRLGMQMFGNDLNPVAWFIVKQEFANVDLDEVKRLLADIEAEVKPQIMPYYYCDGPSGEKGTWTHNQSAK